MIEQFLGMFDGYGSELGLISLLSIFGGGGWARQKLQMLEAKLEALPDPKVIKATFAALPDPDDLKETFTVLGDPEKLEKFFDAIPDEKAMEEHLLQVKRMWEVHRAKELLGGSGKIDRAKNGPREPRG